MTKTTEASKKSVIQVLKATAKRIPWKVAMIVIFLVVVAKDIITNPPTFVNSPKAYEAISENYYVTFKIDGELVQGEATIIAEDNESYIIQMGNQVYVVPQISIVFE